MNWKIGEEKKKAALSAVLLAHSIEGDGRRAQSMSNSGFVSINSLILMLEPRFAGFGCSYG